MKGAKLKSARLAAGLTQKQLGQRMGWQNPKGRVSNIETGRDAVSFEMLQAIADAMGCEVIVTITQTADGGIE